jgi:dTDP-4-amino-4,6-dideoxygalactose transaminase
MRGELEAAIGAVLDSGRFVLEERVETFERGFSEFCGARYSIGVASGTDALTIALRAVGVQPGDEVIVPAFTCVPTVAAVETAGARPVLADVDPATFTLAPGSARVRITSRTRAIVAVHLYGQCADMASISDLGKEFGLRIVEDAAQAHGAGYEGARAGTLADAAAFSFYPTKNLGALGDAGAVVTRNAEVAESARMLRTYGERRRYESIVPGWNSRLDAIQASVLSAGLPMLDGWNRRRRELASRYRERLPHSALTLPAEVDGRHHVYHLYVVRTKQRDALRAALAARGVQTLVHYSRPIHNHPAYRALATSDGDLGGSEELAREVVSLPLYPELTDAEFNAVVAAIDDSLTTIGAASR